MTRAIRDSVVVITGASSGIGKALAIDLHRRGAKLVLAARRKPLLDALNEQLGGGHFVTTCDVAQPADCERLVTESIHRFGRIDTLVCNAGYGPMRTIAATGEKELRDVFATNLFGTVDCIRAAVPALTKQDLRDGYRGQIMIVSSAAARRGLPYFGVYAATKAAQLSVAEALRVELRRQKIAVTSVHPVGTATEFFDVAEQAGGGKLPLDAKIQIKQTAEQVAAAMVRGMIHPRPEVWPFSPVRYALGIGSLFPGLVDLAMGSAFRKIERWNADRKSRSSDSAGL